MLREDERKKLKRQGYAYVPEVLTLREINKTLEADIEQLRVQLAGCLIAAEGGTSDPAKPDAYGWSPAYQAVLDLRVAYERIMNPPTIMEPAE